MWPWCSLQRLFGAFKPSKYFKILQTKTLGFIGIWARYILIQYYSNEGTYSSLKLGGSAPLLSLTAWSNHLQFLERGLMCGNRVFAANDDDQLWSAENTGFSENGRSRFREGKQHLSAHKNGCQAACCGQRSSHSSCQARQDRPMFSRKIVKTWQSSENSSSCWKGLLLACLGWCRKNQSLDVT